MEQYKTADEVPGVLNPVSIIGTDSICSEFSAVNIMGFPVFTFLVTLAEVIILTDDIAFITITAIAMKNANCLKYIFLNSNFNSISDLFSLL